mmetsp:Transcript_32372/g.85443  ORF Transcript_32372/g.85443 Transcript_32372/m.85443 type:complete len:215 (-) Transcript_32372:9-653(-)
MPAAWSKEAPLHRAAVRWLDMTYPNTPRQGGGGFPFAGDARRRGLWGRLQQLLGATKGWPDLFIAATGASGEPGIFFEFKSESGRVSPEQKEVGERLKAHGFHYFIVRDLETFQGLVNMYFTPLPGSHPVTPAAVADAQLMNLVKLQQKAEAAQQGTLDAQQAAREAATEARELRARVAELESQLADERKSKRSTVVRTAPAPAPTMRVIYVLD